MKKLFTRKSKIVITFDKHNLAEARIVNASQEQIICASNLLISDCVNPKINKCLMVRPKREITRNGKNKGFIFKLKRFFYRVAREIFRKKLYKTTVLLNSLGN